MTGHRIVDVEAGSIADQCGIVPGDALLSINGEPVRDQIDYQFLVAGGRLLLEIRHATGAISEISLEKDEAEPLGLTLADSLMARPKTCVNHCVFCFVDQMPPGMRDTLYMKDDDWRLSLMMGNYITLTNLSERAFARVIARRASPLYLSIHATDGAVRARMMGNPRAGDILEKLQRLQDAGISFHCQVVLCPGINDGPVLEDTLKTLSVFFPSALSVALVPVGLTRHREGLPSLTPYDGARAQALLRQAEDWQARLLPRLGTRFVFPSDEFYCLSGHPLPPDKAYEHYPQIENGVGLLRSFEKEFAAAARHADPKEAVPRRVLVATGVSAAPFLRGLLEGQAFPGVEITVRAVENRFFGRSVTVAGLLVGRDILDALRGAEADEILISNAMLRQEDRLFLDGMSLSALTATLGIPVHAVGCDGADFYYALQGEQYRGEG